MLGIAKGAFWLALIVWLGEVVFFSFVVAPSVFGALPQETAGQVVGAILPRYYAVGAAAGAVALVAALALRRATASTTPWSLIGAMLMLMLVATLYAGWAVLPRVQALRPRLHEAVADPEIKVEFERLHHSSVLLNGAVLVLGIATVCVAAATLTLPPR